MTKASEIIDICHDLNLYFPKIVKASEWDGSPIFVVTFGYMAYRQTVTFPARTPIPEVKGIIGKYVRKKAENRCQRNRTPAS